VPAGRSRRHARWAGSHDRPADGSDELSRLAGDVTADLRWAVNRPARAGNRHPPGSACAVCEPESLLPIRWYGHPRSEQRGSQLPAALSGNTTSLRSRWSMPPIGRYRSLRLLRACW
jgi:hypothetical protein